MTGDPLNLAFEIIGIEAPLAQLLRQRGVAVRLLSNLQASREEIGSLDLAGVDTIVISYLELSGSPADLRYLVKRLRQRAPAARVIVGLWPEGEAVLTDAGIQRTIGADLYAGSLHAAVGYALSAPDAEFKQRLRNTRTLRAPPSVSTQLSPILKMSLP